MDYLPGAYSDNIPVQSWVKINDGPRALLWSSRDAPVVSLGALVPDVVGQPQNDAEAAIEAAGLTVGTITQQHSNSVPAGSVISQDPVGGTQVAPGSAVDLVVSLGAAPTYLYLPLIWR